MELSSAELTLAKSVARQVIERLHERSVRLTGTYRLQLHREFNFDDAAAIVPYLRDLGISHVYCSPYLRARPGSMHGYDICDHSQLNPELGGDEGYHRFTSALRECGIGQILDIVPNHMAASLENSWWRDVLENGPASPYSTYFDIDWHPVKHELSGKVLLPILGRQYGDVLEEGELRLAYRDGAFFVCYFDHALPVGPKTTIPLLMDRIDLLRGSLGELSSEVIELESIITALEHLPPQTIRLPTAIRERTREKEVIKRRLRELSSASPAVHEHILKNVDDYNGDRSNPVSFDRLDRLLAAQAYRLSHWRSAADEINYRRFFDINGLTALCMEQPEVFQSTHGLLRQHITNGDIDGFRIDHVDGLFDPEQYLWRLQWSYLADVGRDACLKLPTGEAGNSASDAAWRRIGATVVTLAARDLGLRLPDAEDFKAILPPDASIETAPDGIFDSVTRSPRTPRVPLYVLVEKILGPDEPLPENWPVAGTSGYDFLNTLNGLFVDNTGFAEIEKCYQRFVGSATPLSEVEVDAKLLILYASMSSELQNLAHRLNLISEQHRRSRDFTLNTLRRAIRAVLACFPVYRIYPGKAAISDRDRKVVNLAVVRARRRNPAFDPGVFEFLRSVLLLAHPPGLTAAQIAEREIFTGKFQQVTSPVMAKGVEDTAFYIRVPLVSVNEVGSDPGRCATTVDEFHEANLQRCAARRRAMLASSTHDTKRSEDARARLDVLTEIPRQWRTALSEFSRANRGLVRIVDGESAPSRNDEYLFYQSLLAIWPLTPPDDRERQEIVQRLSQYMEKATREAKQRTSWINTNQEYDAAVREFVANALKESPRNKFLLYFGKLFQQIVIAGQHNALAQATLKLLSPGVPDTFQGQELWDFSLVDPDNRRPVDYELRRRLLSDITANESLNDDAYAEFATQLGRSWRDPRLKLFVTSKLLRLRQANRPLFEQGEYVPLSLTGPRASHLVGIGWRESNARPLDVIAVIPRQIHALLADRDDNAAPIWIDRAWVDTRVTLPDQGTTRYRLLLTRRRIQFEQADVDLGEWLDEFPVVILCRDQLPAPISSDR